jgi:hypothetical protein
MPVEPGDLKADNFIILSCYNSRGVLARLLLFRKVKRKPGKWNKVSLKSSENAINEGDLK